MRGSGLVVVKGNLTVNADVTYKPGAAVSALRNLASVGWLVLKRPDMTGGNVSISPSVQTFSGAVFAEEMFSSGTTGNGDVSLAVYGPVVSRKFSFERNFAAPEQGSEYVIYDSRAVLNPPPGLGDFVRTLPRFKLGTP
jgi:hypothetical protein